MAKQKINPQQQPSANQQFNTANSVVDGPIIQYGVSGIVNGASKAITFPIAYKSVPVVIVTGVGGNGSASTFAYPSALAAAFNDRIFSAVSQSTTGFTVNISGSAVTASQIAEFSWMAIGPA